jgi:hypothetical protein
MAFLFAVSVVVQWNDPDPLFWMALYGAAALLAVLAAIGQAPLVPNLVALALFAALAVAWAPAFFGSRSEAYTSWEMKAPQDEEPREAGGLLLCTVWSAVLSHRAWRTRTSA